MSKEEKAVEDAKRTTISYAMDWGKSPLPPMLLATLVTALHARPFQPLPMLFPPVFLFSTYLNLSEFKTDSAGITAAWSGLYLLLANRRRVSGNGIKARLGSRFNVRGMTRGAAMGLAGINLVGCGTVYVFGKREKKDESP
ncbi:hypothetical protein B0J14DRAFT_44717 [Halenospora varia]|nr:hypothetical protein B0J14DRAFT_44717 [Halenospora varia]